VNDDIDSCMIVNDCELKYSIINSVWICRQSADSDNSLAGICISDATNSDAIQTYDCAHRIFIMYDSTRLILMFWQCLFMRLATKTVAI